MSDTKTLVFGGDHAGFECKTSLIHAFEEAYKIEDYGTDSAESVDYPEFARPVALRVGAHEPRVLGVLICGSGNGVCMTANKTPSVRAALCWNEELARLARAHNNANILCIPARFVDFDTARDMLKAFIETPFEGGRHQRRVQKIALDS